MSTTALAFSAVQHQGHGLVYMLARLVAGESIKLSSGANFTIGNLESEWHNGGKAFIERHWRDAANQPTGHFAPSDRYPKLVGQESEDEDMDQYYEREKFQGKHEWIPTDMLAYVIGCAAKHKDPTWLYLAEVLRIPTRAVVVLPGKVSPDLTGHIGALYTTTGRRKFKPITTGQAAFHDVLRDILRKHLNNQANNPEAYEKDLFDHIDEFYWQGNDIPGLNLNSECPYYFLSGQSQYSQWGPTYGDMRNTLEDMWTTWKVVSQNQFAARKYLDLSPKPTRWEVREGRFVEA